MKNLMKTADRAENFAKFIWQNSNAETRETRMESALEQLHQDTKERLEALKYNQQKSEQIAQRVDLAADSAEEKIKNYIEKGSYDKVASLTKKRIGGSELNNMYRTEIVARLNDILLEKVTAGEVSQEEASQIMLKAMKVASFPDNWPLGDKWKNGKIVQKGKLYYATRMMKYGESVLSKDVLRRFRGYERTKLAKEMARGPEITLDETGIVEFKGKTYVINNFELLVGAAMTKIDPLLLKGFVLENTMLVSGPNGPQLIATMKNGCKGNFVIINLEEVGVVDQKFKKCWDGSIVPIDQPCPPKQNGECSDCDQSKDVIQADTTSEMYKGNILLDKNCPAPIFEKNFAKMSELGVFEKLGIKLSGKTAKEQWNNLSSEERGWVVAEYNHQISMEMVERSEKFYQAAMIMKDMLEKRVDGGFAEGGLWGAIKLLFKKDEKNFAKKLNERLEKAGLGFQLEAQEIEEMIKEGEKKIAEVRTNGVKSIEIMKEKLAKMSPEKQAKFWEEVQKNADKEGGSLVNVLDAVKHGNLYQSKRFAVSDLLIVGSSMVIAWATTGVPLPSIPLFNMKLPRWFGTKIQQLPGLNAMASTSMGKDIDHNYTRFQAETFHQLEKTIQLGDNAAMLGAQLMQYIYRLEHELNSCTDAQERERIYAEINKQNERLQIWVEDMKAEMQKMQKALNYREQRYTKEARAARSHAFGFGESTDGRRKEVRQDYKKIKKALKLVSRGDYQSLTTPETQEAFKRIQDNLTKELNEDFGANVILPKDSEGNVILGKEMTGILGIHEFTLKRTLARDINFKVEVKEKYKRGPLEVVVDEDSVKLGNKGWEKMNKRQQNLVKEYVAEFEDRLAELKELHGIASVIDGYNKAINQRKIRANVYSMEENKDDLENVKESSMFGTLMQWERNGVSRNAILNCKENCFFGEKSKALLQEFFNTNEKTNPAEKLAKFKALQSSYEFKTEWAAMINKIASNIQKITNYRDENGIKRYSFKLKNGKECTPNDIQDVLVRGEDVFIYDNVTGEIAKRVPIIISPVAIKEAIEGKTEFVKPPNVLEAEAHGHGYEYMQSLYSGIEGYEIIWNSTGTAIEGVKIFYPGSTKDVIKVFPWLLPINTANYKHHNIKEYYLKPKYIDGVPYIKDEKGNYTRIDNFASGGKKSRENKNTVTTRGDRRETRVSLDSEIAKFNRMSQNKAKKELLNTNLNLKVVFKNSENGKSYSARTTEKNNLKLLFSLPNMKLDHVEK